MRVQIVKGLPGAREEDSKGRESPDRLETQQSVHHSEPSLLSCLFKIPVGKSWYLYFSNGISESRLMGDTIHTPAPNPELTGKGLFDDLALLTHTVLAVS